MSIVYDLENLANIKSQLSEITTQYYDLIENNDNKDVLELQKQLQENQNLNNNVVDILKELENEKLKNKELIDQLEFSHGDNYEKPTVIYQHNIELTNNLERLYAENIQLKEQIENLSTVQINQMNEENQKLQNEIIKLQTDMIEQNTSIVTKYNNLEIEYNELVNQIEKISQFMNKNIGIDTSHQSIDIVLGELQRFLTNINLNLANSKNEIEKLQRTIENLRMTTDEKEYHLRNMIESLTNATWKQLERIDTEIQMYDEKQDEYKSDPLKLDSLTKLDEYELTTDIKREFLPFFKYISRILNKDDLIDMNISDDDNDNDNNNDDDDEVQYHTCMILFFKLLGFFSMEYIRGYKDYIYRECVRVLGAKKQKQKIVKLTKLIAPQIFQTNSLYFLMNRYNSKCYQPDRVYDFGDYIFNLLKPEFRPDSTKALNLFQPGIGNRYDSILIYTPQTMEDLRKLRDKLASILE